jgi:hypothetical protein
MALEQHALVRIAQAFAAAERAAVIELLESYRGPEPARVVRDILQLSRGSLDEARKYLQAAQTDYRDVLYWAEYHESDPQLRGREPKQLVEGILAKWGGRK